MIYLDNNATTQPLPEVIAAMRDLMEHAWGNPSSVHRVGVDAREAVERARSGVAALIGCAPRELVFTSGGTESAALAIQGLLEARRDRTVIATSRLEHAAVRQLAERLEAAGRCRVLWVDHHRDGTVDMDRLDALLIRHGHELALLSLMAANNETGVLLDVPRVAAMCQARRVPLHTDATQWAGRLPIDAHRWQADAISISAHKMHGPKGVGALALRRGVAIVPQLVGGPQERDRRAGTENVAGIVGFAAAAESAQRWLASFDRQSAAGPRDAFERAVLAALPDAVIHGADAPRLWNTGNIGFPGLEAEAILLSLSQQGVCASAGAACSSGSLDPSPVLLAMGVAPSLAHGSVRFSLSRETTRAEAESAAATVIACVRQLRQRTGSALRPPP